MYKVPAGDNLIFNLGGYEVPAGSSLVFDFLEKSDFIFPVAFWVRKKLLTPESPDPLNVAGIYRVQTQHGKKVQQKMPFYVPTNPRTIKQQENRQRFADAMEAWGNLTQNDKKFYNEIAKQQQLFGWNVFIKEYFAKHPLSS